MALIAVFSFLEPIHFIMLYFGWFWWWFEEEEGYEGIGDEKDDKTGDIFIIYYDDLFLLNHDCHPCWLLWNKV